MSDKNNICCENCIHDDIHYDGNDEEMDIDDDRWVNVLNNSIFLREKNL